MRQSLIFFLSLFTYFCAFADDDITLSEYQPKSNGAISADNVVYAETDSISIKELQELREYKQRNTLRGFKMFFETGFLFNINNDDGDLIRNPDYMPCLFPITASFGYQINNFVFVGGGTGMHLYSDHGTSYLEIPVFANVRINFLSNKKVIPFFDYKCGTTLGAYFSYFGELGLGARLALKNRHAAFITCQYAAGLPYGGSADNAFDTMVLGLKVGYEF